MDNIVERDIYEASKEIPGISLRMRDFLDNPGNQKICNSIRKGTGSLTQEFCKTKLCIACNYNGNVKNFETGLLEICLECNGSGIIYSKPNIKSARK